MGSTFGRQVIGQTGTLIQVAADGEPIWKPGGLTLDWSKVAAVASNPVTTPEGLIVPVGQKWLRYGQVLTKITNKPVQVITINGGPGGGTFTITGTRPDTGVTTTSAPIAYNASAATVQAQMDAIFGAGNTVVSGSAGGPWTVTFQAALLDLAIAQMTADGALLTGGTSPTATVATTTAGGNFGMFGPFDSAASDGRQTLTRGDVFILNETVLESGVLGLGGIATNHPGGLAGGLLWKDRILFTTGSHSLAAGPTVAELEAVMPLIRYAQN